MFYRSGTVNSKSFVGKDFLQNKWKYELTMHFKHEMKENISQKLRIKWNFELNVPFWPFVFHNYQKKKKVVVMIRRKGKSFQF